MTNAFKPIITKKGIEHSISTNFDGVNFRITHVSFGGTKFTPTGQEESLLDERLKVQISSSSKINDNAFKIRARAMTDSPFFCQSIAFWSDNILFAVYSSSNLPSSGLFAIHNNSETIVSYTLALEALGADHFEVVVIEGEDMMVELINNHEQDPHAHGLDEIKATLTNISNPDGYKYVGRCKSIEELRTIEPTTNGQRILVDSYYLGGATGGGEFAAIQRDNENSITIFNSANRNFSWKRLSEDLTIFDAGVKLDEDSTEAIDRLESFNTEFDGLNHEILVDTKRIPALNVKRVAYKFNDISYPTLDFIGVEREVSQITKTPYYTCWTQDKTFTHNNVIYAPFLLAFRHSYDDMRIACTRSFDNGKTWDTPSILVDYHPENPAKGYHSFSSGCLNNRMFMIVEERDNSTRRLITSHLYSRPLTYSKRVTGGIAQNGTVVTVRVEKHGLFAGDYCSFSGTSNLGASGNMQVASVIDENTFTVTSKSSGNGNNAGQVWDFGVSFEQNQWHTQEVGAFNKDGNNATHIHSFTGVNDSEFITGVHWGDGIRGIGFIHYSLNWSEGTVATTVHKFDAVLSSAKGEPAVQFYKDKLYIAARSQGTEKPAIFIRCDKDGSNLEYFNLSTTAIHYTPLSFVILNDEVYMFGTERAENEWETGQGDTSGNRYKQNRPRTMLLRFNLSDFGQSDKVNTTCVYQGIQAGESGSSGCGVGSVVYQNGSVFYLFTDENYGNSHSLTENAKSVNNAFIDNGYQPDIFCLKLKIKNEVVEGSETGTLRAFDNITLPVFRNKNGKREIQCGIDVKGVSTFISLKASEYLASSINRDYGVVGVDYNNDLNRLYLSSSNSPSTAKGSMIVLHNDKSSAPNRIEIHADETRIYETTKLDVVTASTLRASSVTATQLISSNAKNEFSIIGASYSTDNRLYLSSAGSSSSSKGSMIVLHNDKSSAPNRIEIHADETRIYEKTSLNTVTASSVTAKQLISANADRGFSIIGSSYSTDNRLYLSSAGASSSSKGSMIVLHNDKSSAPKNVEIVGDKVNIRGITTTERTIIGLSRTVPSSDMPNNSLYFKRENDNQVKLVLKDSNGVERYATIDFT